MSLIKIENQTDYTFIINSLKITLGGKNTTSGRSYALINDDDLSNAELSELIDCGHVCVEGVKRKKTKENTAKRKYTKRILKNPLTIPYEKNSEVVVTTNDGGIERKRMVSDATDRQPIFVDSYEPDHSEKTEKIDSPTKKSKKVKNEAKTAPKDADDSFIEI